MPTDLFRRAGALTTLCLLAIATAGCASTGTSTASAGETQDVVVTSPGETPATAQEDAVNAEMVGVSVRNITDSAVVSVSFDGGPDGRELPPGLRQRSTAAEPSWVQISGSDGNSLAYAQVVGDAVIMFPEEGGSICASELPPYSATRDCKGREFSVDLQQSRNLADRSQYVTQLVITIRGDGWS